MDPASRSPATLSIRVLAKWLIAVVIGLVALDLSGVAFTAITGHDYVRGLIPLSDLDEEQAPGTVFSVGLMLANALLFMVAAKANEGNPGRARRWWALAVVFLFLTLDEHAAIHERLTGPMRDALPDVGPLYFAWIIPYGAALILFAAWIGPFILRQHQKVRRLFVLAAVTFLSGAIGLEILGGWRMSRVGMDEFDPVYDLLSTTEEALELVGLIFLTMALLHLLRLEHPDRCVKITQ